LTITGKIKQENDNKIRIPVDDVDVYVIGSNHGNTISALHL
jgi:malate/lactate dehydrogenase